jgi:hypothetical protein
MSYDDGGGDGWKMEERRRTVASGESLPGAFFDRSKIII